MSITELLELHKPETVLSDQAWGNDPGGSGPTPVIFTPSFRNGSGTAMKAQSKPRRPGGAVAVLGSGGKTTLLWQLARHFRQERVLVSTTVKMWSPEPGQYDFFPEATSFAGEAKARPGITFAGTVLPDLGKVGALPPEALGKRLSHFDKIFIEADGSRGLPYKGWAEHEPVVPEWIDLTLAVMPIPRPEWVVTESFIHRLPLFCAISGARPGEPLRLEHLAAAIAHPAGLLAKARGRIVLFFNQAESGKARKLARHIASLLPEHCRDRLWKIVAGSARQNVGTVIY